MTHGAIPAGTGLGRSPLDEPPRRPPSRALVAALGLAVLVHAGLAAYLWKARFDPHYRQAPDDAVTEVQLVTPAPPPPPPPPKAKTPPKRPPPPRVQPRPPKAAVAAPIPPLPIPPVPKPVEVTRPPVIRIAPRAPPAPKPAPPPPIITRPDWLERPTAAQFTRYYPDRAARRGVQGRAEIACRVTAGGRLEACAVASERPDGEGFGAAAVKMSRHFKMRPMTRDGVPVAGGTIRIPIRFALPD